MSAGLMGAVRRRRVTWVVCGGEMECVWRLFGGGWIGLAGARVGVVVRREGWSGEWVVPEDVFGCAIVGVDEGFGLRVAVCGVALAVEW